MRMAELFLIRAIAPDELPTLISLYESQFYAIETGACVSVTRKLR